MPQIRIVLDPEREGLGLPADAEIVHLSDDAEMVISGLESGMASGAPSIAFGFTLPDGRVLIVETSWKLFAGAYRAFAAKFGDDGDLAGLALEYDATGAGQRVHVDIVGDDAPQFFECEICGKRTEEPPGPEGATRILQWVHRHYRETHPGWSPPKLVGAA